MVVSASTFGQGNAGGVTITTGSLSLTNGGLVDASTFGQGNAGRLTVQANSVSLDNNGRIRASTQSGSGGTINLQVAEDLTLRNNSFISARAFQEANGGNLEIDARFIVAFPSEGNGNDIIASAEQGDGGNINITAESLFGIAEGVAIEGNNSNDIDASSEFGLSGTVTINTPDVNAIQADTELPDNIVESEQTTAQACQSDRISGRVSGLTIKGKGGIPPEPIDPMNSDIFLVDGKATNPEPQVQSQDIKPIKTSIGDIYPARGVIVHEDGGFILTAYPTDNIDTRTPQIRENCT